MNKTEEEKKNQKMRENEENEKIILKDNEEKERIHLEEKNKLIEENKKLKEENEKIKEKNKSLKEDFEMKQKKIKKLEGIKNQLTNTLKEIKKYNKEEN